MTTVIDSELLNLVCERERLKRSWQFIQAGSVQIKINKIVEGEEINRIFQAHYK